jgi:hypothetical protein
MLCYERRPVGQSVLMSDTHLEPVIRIVLLSNSCRFVDVKRPLWREDRLTIAAGPRQCNLSRIRVLWDPWPYFTVSDFRLPHSGWPDPYIYPLGTGQFSGLENREYDCRNKSRWPRDTLYPAKVGPNLSDKRRFLVWYSSLADWAYGV